jgi:hypothetical protein
MQSSQDDDLTSPEGSNRRRRNLKAKEPEALPDSRDKSKSSSRASAASTAKGSAEGSHEGSRPHSSGEERVEDRIGSMKKFVEVKKEKKTDHLDDSFGFSAGTQFACFTGTNVQIY